MNNILIGAIWLGMAYDVAVIGILFNIPWWFASVASLPLAMRLPDFRYEK
jgi:hypothetical protein